MRKDKKKNRKKDNSKAHQALITTPLDNSKAHQALITTPLVLLEMKSSRRQSFFNKSRQFDKELKSMSFAHTQINIILILKFVKKTKKNTNHKPNNSIYNR